MGGGCLIFNTTSIALYKILYAGQKEINETFIKDDF